MTTVKKPILQVLNDLSKEINDLYGYVSIEGDNFGEPAINSGPCAAFANAFYKCWNAKFDKKVVITFIMVPNSDECWHTLIRLPNGLLFDGGFGVHDEGKYLGKFKIEDMRQYDLNLLEKRAYGLERDYPRYCPNFSITKVTSMINASLSLIDPKDI